MTTDEQYMNKREQNYMFAYNVVPAFLFRSDFAQITAYAHPKGFVYFQQFWERLASILPDEHVVSNDQLATETYQLSAGTYCMVVTMPPAERYLEVQLLGIVFQPKVRYFVAGRSDMPGMDYQAWTVREVTPNGHGRCGMLREPNAEEFLEQIARAMEMESDIRIANGEEMRGNAERIEIFPAEFQMTPPDAILVTAATYKVISQQIGDTSGMPPPVVMQIFQKGGEPMRRVVEAILRDSQQEAFTHQEKLDQSKRTKRWWQFWK
jgi:hypothetical protein